MAHKIYGQNVNLIGSTKLQEKSVTPSESVQNVQPDSGYDGLAKVEVQAIQTEETTVTLSMASGDQTVERSSGKYMTNVKVTKPATMLPANIKKGVDIGGVVGTLEEAKPEQTKSVALSMASGNQVVTPDEGKAMSQVTIIKPATLVSENIKKDVNIGGVVGAFEGGASLNIEYGDTPPTDTTKLWIKAAKPANINIDPEIAGSEMMENNIAALPKAAYGIAAAAVGTKIYLFGGNGYVTTIQCFDTTTNTISTLSATLPTGAYSIAAAAVGNKIYLFGGAFGSNAYLATINVFDTTTNTISTLSATLPTGAGKIAAAVVGTKVYLFGGQYSGSGYLNTINVFDTTTNTISTLSATLPKSANGIAAAAVGNKIYLFGGQGSDILNTIQCFDITTNTISTLSVTLPTEAFYIAAAAVGNKIYLFGGRVSFNNSYQNTIQCFDTTTNTISTLSATLPTVAGNIAAAAVGNKIYLFGGYIGNGSTNDINALVVQITLNSGNIMLYSDNKTNLFAIIATDAIQMRVGVKNVYKGSASNVAELCDAYLHNGTNWVNVNSGATYSS